MVKHKNVSRFYPTRKRKYYIFGNRKTSETMVNLDVIKDDSRTIDSFSFVVFPEQTLIPQFLLSQRS